jgi:hypothetical protein
MKKAPLIYRRSCDHHYIAVVSLPSGKRLRRGTGLRNKDSAGEFATLLQNHVRKTAQDGKLFPV